MKPDKKEDGVFHPGDPVSVWYRSDVECLATVTTVGVRKMVLSDKSEWKVNGYRPWGSANSYVHRRVLHRNDGDRLNCLRYRARGAIQRITCEQLAEADLRTILEIARRSEKAAEKEPHV